MVAKKGNGDRKPPVQMNLLDDVAKKALRDEARKSVIEEMTQDARDEYFRRELAKVRREHTPTDQIVPVVMDLAPFAAYVAIDGVQYFHGGRYDVPRATAVVIYEQMQRTWLHQDEIDGRSRYEAYRRPQNTVIGPRHAGAMTSANPPLSLPDDMEV